MTACCDLKTAIYEYETLTGHPDDTIRLLTVQPGTSELINCHISYARLSEKPSYRALSYVWGNDERSDEIKINGKKFLVRSNTAICVDQADVIERNAQVLLMSKVYVQARAVISWLGLEIDFGRLDWDDVKEISQENQTGFRARLLTRKEETHRVACAVYETVKLLALNPYWERTWITQKVLLGQPVVLWYGSFGELSLEDLGRLYCFMVEFDRIWGQDHRLFRTGRRDALHEKEVLHQLLAFKYWGKIASAHLGNHRERANTNLADLVIHASRTRCTDGRDKIYAFLSLAKDTGEYGIVPDYGKNPADLFFDFYIKNIVVNKIFQGGFDAGYFGESLRIQLECTHGDLSLSLRFRGIGNPECKGDGPYDCLMSKISWVLQRHALEFPEQTSSQPMVLTGPLLQPPQLGLQEIERYHLSYFMATVFVGTPTQHISIIPELECEDILITWVHHPPLYHPPLTLYHLGRARDVFEYANTSQEPTDFTLPRGIRKYTLDEHLFEHGRTCLLKPMPILQKYWSEVAQRSLERHTIEDATS